jgi:hypothetical protein
LAPGALVVAGVSATCSKALFDTASAAFTGVALLLSLLSLRSLLALLVLLKPRAIVVAVGGCEALRGTKTN